MVEGRDHWWHDIVDAQPPDCAPLPLDSEHMLYLLYTSGSTAKPKGIFHTTAGYLLGHLLHPRDDLRPQAGRRVLVRGRHRLGDRPQLHRLRAARQRRHRRDVRGHARHARVGPLVADHRGLQGLDPVLRPDRHPGVHEAGRGAPAEARPVIAARARVRRRADQSRGMALVQRAHRRGQGTDRRHLVADRDGPDPDLAAARRHDHQARQRHLPVPRHRGRRRRWRWQLGAPRRRRLPRPEAALAGDAARHLRRPGALQADLLEPLPGHVLRGRRRQARRGRLLLAARAGRRRHERLRASPVDDRDRERARLAPRGRRGGRRRRAGPGDRRGDHLLRDPAQGHRADRRAGEGAPGPRVEQDQPDRQAQVS